MTTRQSTHASHPGMTMTQDSDRQQGAGPQCQRPAPGTWRDGLMCYLGIRYAAPPIGPLRFQAPQAVSGHDASSHAPARFGSLPLQAARTGNGNWSRAGDLDCLTLNIWAPDIASTDAPLPVMVWVPGGGYIRGGASQPIYDGASLARRGMVVVTVNYRIGVDGFLDMKGMPRNRGLLDLLAALRWIRRRIAAYGGDPARITVAGQSAGAGAIVQLLRMPASRGLFDQVILQSPSLLAFTPEDADIARQAITSMAGCGQSAQDIAAADPFALARAVAQLSEDSALRAHHGFAARHRFALRPVIAGDRTGAGNTTRQDVDQHGETRQDACRQADMAAQVASCDQEDDDGIIHADIQWWPRRVLIGANREEARFYLVPSGEIDRVTPAMLQAALAGMGIDDAAMAQLAADWPVPCITPGDLLCAAQTEFHYAAPMRQLAQQAVQAGAKVHRYLFDWRSPACDGRMGAAHGVEVPFVFGTLNSLQGRMFAGTQPPVALSRRMQSAWARFVQTGDCGWPTVDAAAESPVQVFSADDA